MKNIKYWKDLLDKYVDYKQGNSIFDEKDKVWFKNYKVNYIKMLLRNKDQEIIYKDVYDRSISNEKLVELIIQVIKFIDINDIKPNDNVFINLDDKILAIALSFACMIKNVNFCFLLEGYTNEYILAIDDIVKANY